MPHPITLPANLTPSGQLYRLWIQSNFLSAEPLSAWWTIYDTVCRTEGYTFVRVLQSILRAQPRGRTYDGTYVSGSQVNVDGKWGPLTQKVLFLALLGAGASEAMKGVVTIDGAQRRIGRGSLTAAVWIMQRARGGSEPTISFPTDMVLPVWGQAPPQPASRSGNPIECEPIPPETPPVAPAPPPTERVEPPPAPTPEGEIENAADEQNLPLPTGRRTDLAVVSVGVPWKAVGIVALSVAAIGLFGMMVARAAPPARSRRRRRRAR